MEYIIEGSNRPPVGSVSFTSSDHVRFQNGKDVSGHNIGCNRRFVIENNIEGNEGYTITMYNLDGNHPIWRNNIQMAPKRMRIDRVNDNMLKFRGFGVDENALTMGASLKDASFDNYGLIIMLDNGAIKRTQLNIFDRNISIVYIN